MRKSRFSEGQIVVVLKQAEAGVPIQDLIRKYGICEQTFYRWKKKYGGLAPCSSSRASRPAFSCLSSPRGYPLCPRGTLWDWNRCRYITRSPSPIPLGSTPRDPPGEMLTTTSLSFILLVVPEPGFEPG